MSRPRKTPPIHKDYDPNDFISKSEAEAYFYEMVHIKSGFGYHVKKGNISFFWGVENDQDPQTDKYVKTSDNRCVMFRVAAIERDAKVFLSNKVKKAV